MSALSNLVAAERAYLKDAGCKRASCKQEKELAGEHWYVPGFHAPLSRIAAVADIRTGKKRAAVIGRTR